jgi:hypothetical protein
LTAPAGSVSDSTGGEPNKTLPDLPIFQAENPKFKLIKI